MEGLTIDEIGLMMGGAHDMEVASGMIRLERRPDPSRLWSLATPPLAVLTTMIAGGLLFAALGKDPFEAIRTIFWDPLFNDQFAAYSRPQLLVKAGPLILIAIGLSLGFRAGIWNIGAEGQYIIGALAGAGVALALYPMETVFLFPAMVIAGALGGWAWAMIPGILKTRFNTNEILVSLLLVYVAEQIMASMAVGLMRNPEGSGFPGSRNLQQYASAANTDLIPGTGMHWGVVAAFIAVIFAYILLNRHIMGFNIRLAGQAPRRGAVLGRRPQPAHPLLPRRLGRACGHGRALRGGGPRGSDLHRLQRGLRVHGDHRGLPRPPPSRRASCWQASSWHSPISAASWPNSCSRSPPRRSRRSRGCCSSSFSRATC